MCKIHYYININREIYIYLMALLKEYFKLTNEYREKYREKKLLDGRKEQLKAGTTKTGRLDSKGIDKLQAQLEKLDDDTRNVIMLRFYSQASFKEIAQMRSEPIGTTLSKVHRGLKKLRQLMG